MGKYKKNDFAEPNEGSVVLKMEFNGAKYPSFSSLSSLLYDLELLHDFSVIIAYDKYERKNISSRTFMYRNGRNIDQHDLARVVSVSKNSPLTLELAVSAIGGLWVMMQIIDKISNWSINRKKINLEIEKLEHEVRLKKIELDEKIRSEREINMEHQIINRLESSTFKLKRMSVYSFKDKSKNQNN